MSTPIDWPAFYEAAQEATAVLRAEYRHELNVPYGAHERQIIDLYFPGAAGGSAPVVVFFHGGGFRDGRPGWYGYLGRHLLERGAIFACAGYRLLPDAYLPEAARDAEAALRWLHTNIGAKGGDPSRLSAMGHSAGAILVAHIAVRYDWLRAAGMPDDSIKAAVLISAPYDARLPSAITAVRSDADRPAASPLAIIQQAPRHSVITYGGTESAGVLGDGPRLAEELIKRGGAVQLMPIEGGDHASVLQSLTDEGSPLLKGVAALVT